MAQQLLLRLPPPCDCDGAVRAENNCSRGGAVPCRACAGSGSSDGGGRRPRVESAAPVLSSA